MSSNPVYSITHGFTRLRSPYPPTGVKKERWLEQLRDLCHRVDCLQNCSFQSLHKVTQRLEKISKSIPKVWFFKSEAQQLIENAQKAVEQLKKSSLKWDLVKPVERNIEIPSFKATTFGRIFLLALYFQSAFGLTPQTFSGNVQTMREEEPVDHEKQTSGREESSAERGSTSLQGSSPSYDDTAQETLILRDSVQKGSLSLIVKPVNKRNGSPQNRRLQREASIFRAQKTRHITFGTTYVSGNPDRDALSKRVSDNQQEYAQYWRLNGKVVTESLLQGQCQGLTCVPYWNKVAILKTWLEHPSSRKEEWYILADDDMPVTNMNINPYEAIDLLRKGQDASIIIVRDVVQWKRGDRDISVNTGVLIVRKDQKSKEFIEKLWAKRNNVVSDDPNCRTLGTCKTQDVLHEQEAFAQLLEEDPSLLTRVVKVVNYRDQYQGRSIALNTFKRDGCFIRVQDGWKDNAFSYNDPSDGAWQQGDWMGQTAGVPIVGKECETGVSRFFRLDYLNSMLARIIPIDTDVPSSQTSQPVRTPKTAAKRNALSALVYDQELMQEPQTPLLKRNHQDRTQLKDSPMTKNR